jgi:hypothetical protein
MSPALGGTGILPVGRLYQAGSPSHLFYRRLYVERYRRFLVLGTITPIPVVGLHPVAHQGNVTQCQPERIARG